MTLKEILKDAGSIGIVLLLAGAITMIPSPRVAITTKYLKTRDFIPYDIDHDGNIDAIGFRTTDSFAYAKPNLKDSRVDGFTVKLTPDDVKTINDYFKLK